MQIQNLIQQLQDLEKQYGNVECCSYDEQFDIYNLLTFACANINPISGKKVIIFI